MAGEMSWMLKLPLQAKSVTSQNKWEKIRRKITEIQILKN